MVCPRHMAGCPQLGGGGGGAHSVRWVERTGHPGGTVYRPKSQYFMAKNVLKISWRSINMELGMAWNFVFSRV